MKAWFESLQPRERVILLAGAVAAALIVLWAGILAPLDRSATELRAAVATKERLLIDVTRVQGLQPQDAAPASRGGTHSLVVLVDTTRQPHGLEFARTRPDGPNGINVTFQNASFDALVDWLIAIEANHGVVVETASFSSTRDRGLVSGQLFLRRS